MPQLFPPSADTVVKAILIGLPLLIVTSVLAVTRFTLSPFWTRINEPVDQTVPFSHQHHVGELGIDCRYCHTSVTTSSTAGYPPTETCMTCHSQVWPDAPVLAPVRQSWATGRPLQWNRVHNLPVYVYFDHSIHVQKGVACVHCHGRVDRMPLMAKSETLYMRWCLDCHQAPESHLRPANAVFAMAEPASAGAGETQFAHPVLREKARLQDCSICHR